MKWLQIINKLKLKKEAEMDPAAAYDAWSLTYDKQVGNLMLDREKLLFSTLLEEIELTGKMVLDVGCGTGRHWKKINALQPARLVGSDVSAGMLSILAQKFPGAETHLLSDHRLLHACDGMYDVLISTLTLAHMADMQKVFAEWDRVVKPGGKILVTDYHPAMFSKGADRSFMQDEKTIKIINYTYPVEEVKRVFLSSHYSMAGFREEAIEEQHLAYYLAKNALHIYHRFKGTPFLYGMIFQKNASL